MPKPSSKLPFAHETKYQYIVDADDVVVFNVENYGSYDDIAYIVHAANSHHRLVDMLKRAAESLSKTGWSVADDVRDLLDRIGET